MTSFLLSALARKFRGASLESFRAVHGHCWLIWEPGVWRPPARGPAVTTTMSAVKLATPPPSSGEALALALVPRQGRAGQVTVGRAPTNDIEINDATLSQTHLLLMEAEPGKWTVRDAGSKNGSWLNEAPIAPGLPVALTDGDRVQAAQVCLTFYRPEGLLDRLNAWKWSPTPVPSKLVGR